MASVGCSVASARDAKESMIRFSHSIWTAVRGDSWSATAPMQAVLTATMFTVNCSNHSTQALAQTMMLTSKDNTVIWVSSTPVQLWLSRWVGDGQEWVHVVVGAPLWKQSIMDRLAQSMWS